MAYHGNGIGSQGLSGSENWMQNLGSLAQSLGDQYTQYVPGLNQQLSGMIGQTPQWMTDQYRNQLAGIQRGGTAAMSGALNTLSRNGMMQSGQANNLMAGVARNQGQLAGQAYNQLGQQADARQQQLIQMLLASANSGMGGAMSGYNSMASYYGNQEEAKGQTTGGLLGIAGKLLGNIFKF